MVHARPAGTVLALLLAQGLAAPTLAQTKDPVASTERKAAQAVQLDWSQMEPIPGVRELQGRVTVRPRPEFRNGAVGVGPAWWSLQELESTATDRAARVRAATERTRLEGLRDISARLGLDHAAEVIDFYPEVDEYVLRVPAGVDEFDYIRSLIATGVFEYAEPDWLVYPTVESDDPRLSDQWHHGMVGSREAWDINTAVLGTTKVAIVDTGFDQDHEDLAALLEPGYNSADNLPENEGGDISDINGHGTHVAGCAAAEGNNGIGVSGMGWGLRIVPIRASNASSGGASLSALTGGARWGIDQGARVASVSYSGVGNNSPQTTGEYIRGANGLLCWAAGNNGSDRSGFDHEDVLIIGASTSSDNRSGFSNYGLSLDLVSPGSGILATTYDGAYGSKSGTSMATPVAAGVVGLIYDTQPAINSQLVEAILNKTAVDKGDPGEDNDWGFGRIDAAAAVQLASAIVVDGRAVVAVNDADRIFGVGEPRVIDVLANDATLTGTLSIATHTTAAASGATITLVTDADGTQRLEYVPPAGFTGWDSFEYTATDGEAVSAPATVHVHVISQDQFKAPDVIAGSMYDYELDVTYYQLEQLDALPDFSTLSPALRSSAATVEISSTNGVFSDSGMSDDVGAVYEGYFLAPAADLYTFETVSDDGSKLYIGGDEIVNNDGLHGMRSRTGDIALQAGWHSIRVEFFERGGGAGLLVYAARTQAPGKSIVEGSFARGCRADRDRDGLVQAADLLQYIQEYRDLAPIADLNGDGTHSARDVLLFIRDYRVGCP